MSASRVLKWGWLLALCVGVSAWVVQAEYRHASIQIGSSLPAVPALAALLALAAAARVLRRRRHEGSVRGIAAVYLTLVMAAAVPTTPSLVYLFGQITAAQSQADRAAMAPVLAMLPAHMAPAPGPDLRAFFDGSPSGAIPWHLWAVPLVGWGLFLVTMLATLGAALALFRRSWMDHERLTYPMVQIPLRILSASGNDPANVRTLFWLGFGFTATLDGMNMLRAFSPTVPAIGTGWDIGLWFPDRPWSALAPLWVSYRPEIFGLAYLMPRDVLLTAWLSYVALRLSTVVRVALGSQVPSTPYDYQELGMGAFLLIFAILIIRAYPDLRASLRRAIRSPRADDEAEPMSPRWAWATVIVGPILMAVWLRSAGLPWWVASAHLGLLMAVAIVYARIRCEAGTPSVYLFPFWQQQSLLTNLFGTHALAGVGGRGLVGLALMGGLSRGVFPELSAYAAEGMSLADKTGISQRAAMRRYLIGATAGLIAGGLLYLSVCYSRGADNIGGGYQLAVMRRQFETTASQLGAPALPKPDLVFQTFLGGLIALSMNWARARALWFPLHPVGFAMTSAYGFHLWFPFFVAWIVKGLILRFGGHAAYSRFVPLFLGIAMGRYLFTGIVWGLLGMTGHPAVQSYHIHFS
ncbi:MAG: hypothetical protein GX446_03700 [Chthonomonadales bacterium]|nr:hypothetical protein [Chthonomonadales bacterium]